MEQSSADIHICAKYMRGAVALRLLPVCAGPRTSSGALVDARGAHSAHSWRPRSAAPGAVLDRKQRRRRRESPACPSQLSAGGAWGVTKSETHSTSTVAAEGETTHEENKEEHRQAF